jgi:hypothetical protein
LLQTKTSSDFSIKKYLIQQEGESSMSFKQSKTTPGSNKMWEGSRMMLPEHVTMLRQHAIEKKKKTKPELDEQAVNDLAIQIQQAYQNSLVVSIAVFDVFEDQMLTGRITRLDPQLKQLKLERGEDFEWIRFSDILNISSKEDIF